MVCGGQSTDEPALAFANPPSCSQSNQSEGCVFEEKLFVDEVKAVIKAASTSAKPLFLCGHLILYTIRYRYRPSMLRFSFINDEKRRLNHAMGNYLDDAIGEVVVLLKEPGMERYYHRVPFR